MGRERGALKQDAAKPRAARAASRTRLKRETPAREVNEVNEFDGARQPRVAEASEGVKQQAVREECTTIGRAATREDGWW